MRYQPYRGEPGTETTAFARFADNLQLRLMASQDMLNDGEAQAGTTGFTRTAAIYAIKTFRQARNMLGFNTDAAVLHRKYPLPVTNRPIQGDFAAVDGIAYSIADEITKSATQLVHASQQLRISIKIEAELKDCAS